MNGGTFQISFANDVVLRVIERTLQYVRIVQYRNVILVTKLFHYKLCFKENCY